MNLSQKKLLDIAQNAINELEFSEYEHETILEYLQINEEEYQTIVNANEDTKHYVYILQIDYSTDDYEGVETQIFHTREKAVEEFKQQIECEKRQTWIQDAYKDGKLLKGYELEENANDTDAVDLFWNISCHENFYLHTFIDMRQVEVK